MEKADQSFIFHFAKRQTNGQLSLRRVCERHTGQFFHGNETLAAGMGVDVRSIQRYLSELRRLGWLERNHVAGKRRAFQLSIPSGIDIGAKRGKGGGSEMPILSSKRDKDDAPSINQVFNNNGWNLGGPPMSSV